MVTSEINSKYIFCMDGRLPVAFASKGGWFSSRLRFHEVGDQATAAVAPAMPGAGLGTLAFVEQQYALSAENSIPYVERALKDCGIKPTYHIDDHHADAKKVNPFHDLFSEAALAALIMNSTGGCGFGARMFRERNAHIISMLRDNGWVVQVLTGQHLEKHAIKVEQQGVAIHHHSAHRQGSPTFSMNTQETELVLSALYKTLRRASVLGREIEKTTFVQSGMTWMLSQFRQIALDLGGVSKIHTVQRA